MRRPSRTVEKLYESMKKRNTKRMLNESLAGFTSAGIPASVASSILTHFNIEHDAKITPIEKKPSAANWAVDEIIISVLPNGSAIAVANDQTKWFRLDMLGRRPELTSYVDLRSATAGMSIRGQFFSVRPKRGVESILRGEKPAPGHQPQRIDLDEIYDYMNRVYLPRIRAELEGMVDEIYSSLRRFSGVDQRRALGIADTIRDVAEAGFNRQTMEDFLDVFGRRHRGFASIPLNRKELEDILLNEPNARQKWVKTVLDSARKQFNMIMDRLD